MNSPPQGRDSSEYNQATRIKNNTIPANRPIRSPRETATNPFPSWSRPSRHEGGPKHQWCHGSCRPCKAHRCRWEKVSPVLALATTRGDLPVPPAREELPHAKRKQPHHQPRGTGSFFHRTEKQGPPGRGEQGRVQHHLRGSPVARVEPRRAPAVHTWGTAPRSSGL